MNHKRVYRLYQEEGLAMRRRKGKRLRAQARVPLELPTRTNQMWTMDFTRDSLANGEEISHAQPDAGGPFFRCSHHATRR